MGNKLVLALLLNLLFQPFTSAQSETLRQEAQSSRDTTADSTEAADFEAAEWLKVLGLAIACGGLFLNAQRLAQANRQRSVEQVSAVSNALFDDKELRSTFYKFEYSSFDYHDDFHGSESERHLDKLLSRFESLAHQQLLGLIKLKDMQLVAYEYLVVYRDRQLAGYFVFLDEWFRERGQTRRPFDAFRTVGEKLEELHG